MRSRLKHNDFSKLSLTLFAVVTSCVGVYLTFFSHALPNCSGGANGDLNCDGKVNVTDLSILLVNFNQSNNAYDVNNDGKVDILDLSKLLSYFNISIAQTYDDTVKTDNPVAFWDLSSGNGTEIDVSQHGHNGTYQGGSPALVNMPNGDKAADFNGSSEYVTVPSSSTLSISTSHAMTWEGWIRPDTLQYPGQSGEGYVDWMGKCQNYSPTCEWEARMYSTVNTQDRCNRLSAYAFNPSAGLGSGAAWQPNCGMLQPGQWLHVVGEYQTNTTPNICNITYPGTIDIWVNGIKWNQSSYGTTGCMSQYSITPMTNNSPVNIGTMAKDFWFEGAIGKVAIYNYLLSDTQITNHYKTMTGNDPIGSCANTCSL